jgi:hypothetical protein
MRAIEDCVTTVDWLRAYAADNGFSHGDYADTMRTAADTIERLTAELTEQKQLFADYQKFMAGAAIDAKRYRYFKECFTHPVQLHALATAIGCRFDEFAPDLDTSIDQAIKEAKS